MWSSQREFEATLQQRWPFFQGMEEMLKDREPVICTNLSKVETEITTPTCLQHVGEHIVEIAKSDWTDAKQLRGTVVPYLTELIELWETIFQRHWEARGIFAGAERRPYCLFLRSFTGVTNPIEVPGARLVFYLNEPALDANFAETLVTEAEWLNPVSCLHTDDMQLLKKSGPVMPAFRVHTVNWQRILSDAIASSGSIILYVDEESPGVNFEIGRIREYGLEPQTVLVHRGNAAPDFAQSAQYAGVMSVDKFIKAARKKRNPGILSNRSGSLLRQLDSKATTQTVPSQRLLTMPCEIVDPGIPADFDQADPETSYFVAASNAAAFVNYVENLPDSLFQWNAMSQDMRLRGIQPQLADFNALYRSLRMAFASASCLGFTASIACTIGLLAKVSSMAKHSPTENQKRVKQYMRILDIAGRFDTLTEHRAWAEKIEAFRNSILEDPFM